MKCCFVIQYHLELFCFYSWYWWCSVLCSVSYDDRISHWCNTL